MDQSGLFRLGIFAAILAVMALWEAVAPYRPKEAVRRPMRWLTNFGLLLLSAALARFTIGAAMIAAAIWAQANGWGINNLVGMPALLSGLVTIIVLDCAIYWQHRLTHIVPVFWRFHRVHHCDTEFDVSTAVRFHPVEIVASALYKSTFVVLIGADPWAVVIYESMLSGFALFNHGNVHLPKRLDRALRRVVVTPDMHRVHHSSLMKETNSNYGNILSIWDRIFVSYIDHTKVNDHDMQIGLKEFRDMDSQSLLGVLWMPFR
ncbi:MAG: fatty acid hydroxylase [Thalassospira sp.]|uniref:sterol desaturase family protein n=1 Tax=Thalassospira sp. UBA4513 TaxID=1947675 RepID=UPI000C44DA5B|nr:sterol desaturase family protein [Thalassospira sp. UBA4513]MBE70524.1 fatty acid hydroxylase [Thalassospira sp.]|tara:strand:+ start:564 stop:1349 length:786 start_codon:yes stop_codon:yes gene_type:complete